jgi:hypothetical protein
MTYNNLTNEVTSVQGTWTIGSTFSYSTLQLQSGIIHKDQLEVERIFELPTSASVTPPETVNIKDNISTHDLHRIFIVNKDDYTVNETTKEILTLTPSSPTVRTYTFQKGTLAGKTYSIPTITSTEVVIVRRKTVSNTSYVSWSAGSRLTSDQLNLQISQLLKLNQEIIYKLESEYLRVTDISGDSAPSFSISNDLDMGGNKILTLGNPTPTFGADLQNAVNKAYIESHFVNLDQSQNQTINGNKTFSGTTTFTGAVAANGGFTCDSTAFSVADTTGNTSIGGTLTVTGQANLNGGLNMDSGAFTVADTSGNTVVGGTLQVNGASTLASASVTGALTVDTTTLVVDASNDRVGIGTASPATTVSIYSASNPTLQLVNSTSGTTATDGALFQLNSNDLVIRNREPGYISLGISASEYLGITTSGISVTGRITATAQPAFYATRTTTAQTAVGTIVFDTEVTDIGSIYAPGTGRFTAPVAGVYEFNFSLLADCDTASNSFIICYFRKGTGGGAPNTQVGPSYYSASASTGALNFSPVYGNIILSLVANDTIEVYLGTVNNSAAVNAGAFHSFSGKLLA